MRYSFSKRAKKDFAEKMNEINVFCQEHGIVQSQTGDSYYFTVNGQRYRVSNHTVEQSNRKAFDEFGNRIRESYHPDSREDDVVYITASKTRIIEIYNHLQNGYKLNKRGQRKE